MADNLYNLYHGNVCEAYSNWPAPDLIISDGAYGVRGFRGDTTDAASLADWYQPHILEWAKVAKPSTSLWFWNTEVSWATVHPLLLATGWEYVQLGIWDRKPTVETLNAARAIWDPQGRWADYEFKRYAESFPDVRLESNDGGEPLIGIELKGWYLLAKEEEPSFRFKASANAMTVWDLIAVFPWSLSNVISGKPVLEAPFIEQAKYAADMRTEYWENRSATAQPVEHPDTHPYPDPRSAYSDIVHDDHSNNFGRIARITGLMDDWVKEAMATSLAGIEARWWVKFFKLFDERGDESTIRAKFERLAARAGHDSAWVESVVAHVTGLMEL